MVRRPTNPEWWEQVKAEHGDKAYEVLEARLRAEAEAKARKQQAREVAAMRRQK